MFAMFVFKIKVSLILKMRQRNYQLMKQINQLVVSQELCYYSTGFDFKVCLRARKVTGTFEERAPDAATGMFVTEISCWPRSDSRFHITLQPTLLKLANPTL